MRLISNRLYFDYNATSPLANSVKDFLGKGEFLFGNPSSIHSTGKHAKSFINETTNYLTNLFKLTSDQLIFYHSGASEGISTVIKGFAEEQIDRKRKICFIYGASDHVVATNLKSSLTLFKHKAIEFKIDKNGDFDSDYLINLIRKESRDYEVILNFTVVNNETGIVWPLSEAVRVKKATGCIVHVDAAQLPGKIKDWNILNNELDAYTFSAHKFGGMKGVGFTIIRKDFKISPLILGGGQQLGMRSGTLNSLGIFSIKLSLIELEQKFNWEKAENFKNKFKEYLKKLIGTKGEIVGENGKHKNCNTICVILYGKKADFTLALFDTFEIDISTGSACSSNLVSPSKVLQAMGYSDQQTRESFRFSFSPFESLTNLENYQNRIEEVLKKILIAS